MTGATDAGDSERPRASDGSSTENRAVAVLAVFLVILLSALYITFAPPPQRQPWDSLAYPSIAESGGFGGVQGNHPLGHVLHFGGFFLARQFGYEGRALPLFQGINAVTSAGVVSLMFLLSAVVLGNSLIGSLAIALILAGCYSLWSLAGTAEIYSVAVGFSFLAWAALLVETASTRRHLLLLSGACVGLAVLAHQLNTVLFLVAMVLILGQRIHWQSRTASFLGAAALVIVAGYLLIGALSTSSASLGAIISWARGYVGSYSATGRYLTWRYLPEAWKQATEGVLFSVWSSPKVKMIQVVLWAAMGLFVLERARQWHRLDRRRRTILVAALAQWSVCFLLVWYWEPFAAKYWSLTLAPAAMALASLDGAFARTNPPQVFRRHRMLERGRQTLLLAFAGAILVLSLLRGIKAERNQAPAAGAVWTAQSSAQDLLIPPAELVPYLKYWENRRNTESLMPMSIVGTGLQARLDELRLSIDHALCGGQTVYFAPASIDMLYQADIDRYATSDARDQFRLLFEGYRQQPAFSYVSDGRTIQVNRIVGPTSCAKSSSALPGTPRKGDIRHCSSDNGAATEALGCRPEVNLAAGQAEPAVLCFDSNQASAAQSIAPRRELAQAGLPR